MERYPSDPRHPGAASGRSLTLLAERTRSGWFIWMPPHKLIQAMDDLRIHHQVATPYRPQTNLVAERTVRTVVEASRTALLHADMPPCFWPCAARRACLHIDTRTVEVDLAWQKRNAEAHSRGSGIRLDALHAELGAS